MQTLTKLFSAALFGLEGIIVEIEADTANSLPSVSIVGLPDTIVQESKERIRAAIKNSELPFPRKKITINLAPADIRKEGTHYDLPIALTILQTTLQSKNKLALSENDFIVGELGLSGEVRGVKGVLAMVLLAKERGFSRVIVPFENRNEALLVEGVSVLAVKSLKDLVEYLSGRKSEGVVALEGTGISADILEQSENVLFEGDFAHIKGQEHIKRALEIAAAGNHNILMVGSPGAGKTLLAKALRTILPPLTKDEIVEVTRLYSSIGEYGIKYSRPFRQPHHSASVPALVGGGNTIRPGEITMAHRGILFLDELGEFNRSVLESLRQPLEEGKITVARAKGAIEYPAKIILVVAQNPCPCGFYNDPKKECTCSLGQVQKYHRKISGPLLDRIDMHLDAPPVEIKKLVDDSEQESSCEVRLRVIQARKRQQKHLQNISCTTNSELSVEQIKKKIILTKEAQTLLEIASENMNLSARGYFRVMRVAKTIADLDESDTVCKKHIAEALQYRQKIAF